MRPALRAPPAAAARLARGLVVVLAAAMGCAGGDHLGAPPSSMSASLTAASVDPQVLPGSSLKLTGQSFPVGGQLTVTITGQYQAGSGAAVPSTITVPGKVDTATGASLILDLNVLAALSAGQLADGGAFTGAVTIAEGSGQLGVTFRTFSNLDPDLVNLTPDQVFLGDKLTLAGTGFIGDGEEGESRLVLDGTFTPDDGSAALDLADLEIPCTFVDRGHLEVALSSDFFGIKPGQFQGSLKVVNDVGDNAPRESDSLDNQGLTLSAPLIVGVSPGSASRGQKITMSGAGFLAADVTRQENTLIKLDGTFQPSEIVGGGDARPVSLVLSPDVVDSQTLEYVLRVELNPDGNPTGLGAVPGVFNGTLTPVVVKGRDEVDGTRLRCGDSDQCTFEVLPALQVVYVKFLPNFTDGLRRFGMRNVEEEVRAQVMGTAALFYTSYNIEFRDQPPTDFVEYSTVEVGGPDPNGAGLFGLDNTDGKDSGNMRFNDYIGGSNAASAQEGYYAFGGVFIESFLALSPTMKIDGEPLPIATPRFDEIFKPFVPEMGGSEVAASEIAAGPRATQIAEAIRVLGNLIGSTVSHEFGHSLGMSIEPGNFHNLDDEPNELMDSGSNRPFEERAQMDGRGPEEFSQRHQDYLSSILPRP